MAIKCVNGNPAGIINGPFSLAYGNIWQLWRVICALCYGVFFGMIGHLYFCKSPCPKSKISWFNLIFSRTKPIWLYKTCPHLLSDIYIYSVSFGQVTFIHKPENIFKCLPVLTVIHHSPGPVYNNSQT